MNDPDWTKLLDLSALTRWTLERQQEHTADQQAYEAALAEFQVALRNQRIAGDGKLAPQMRARKVERHLKGLVKASKKAQKAAESLRTTYASHTAYVAALPGQRAEKARKKELKKGSGRRAVESAATKSLHKTGLHGVGGQAGDSKTGEAGVRGISDLWEQKGKSA